MKIKYVLIGLGIIIGLSSVGNSIVLAMEIPPRKTQLTGEYDFSKFPVVLKNKLAQNTSYPKDPKRPQELILLCERCKLPQHLIKNIFNFGIEGLDIDSDGIESIVNHICTKKANNITAAEKRLLQCFKHLNCVDARQISDGRYKLYDDICNEPEIINPGAEQQPQFRVVSVSANLETAQLKKELLALNLLDDGKNAFDDAVWEPLWEHGLDSEEGQSVFNTVDASGLRTNMLARINTILHKRNKHWASRRKTNDIGDEYFLISISPALIQKLDTDSTLGSAPDKIQVFIDVWKSRNHEDELNKDWNTNKILKEYISENTATNMFNSYNNKLANKVKVLLIRWGLVNNKPDLKKALLALDCGFKDDHWNLLWAYDLMDSGVQDLFKNATNNWSDDLLNEINDLLVQHNSRGAPLYQIARLANNKFELQPVVNQPKKLSTKAPAKGSSTLPVEPLAPTTPIENPATASLKKDLLNLKILNNKKNMFSDAYWNPLWANGLRHVNGMELFNMDLNNPNRPQSDADVDKINGVLSDHGRKLILKQNRDNVQFNLVNAGNTDNCIKIASLKKTVVPQNNGSGQPQLNNPTTLTGSPIPQSPQPKKLDTPKEQPTLDKKTLTPSETPTVSVANAATAQLKTELGKLVSEFNDSRWDLLWQHGLDSKEGQSVFQGYFDGMSKKHMDQINSVLHKHNKHWAFVCSKANNFHKKYFLIPISSALMQKINTDSTFNNAADKIQAFIDVWNTGEAKSVMQIWNFKDSDEWENQCSVNKILKGYISEDTATQLFNDCNASAPITTKQVRELLIRWGLVNNKPKNLGAQAGTASEKTSTPPVPPKKEPAPAKSTSTPPKNNGNKKNNLPVDDKNKNGGPEPITKDQQSTPAKKTSTPPEPPKQEPKPAKPSTLPKEKDDSGNQNNSPVDDKKQNGAQKPIVEDNKPQQPNNNQPTTQATNRSLYAALAVGSVVVGTGIIGAAIYKLSNYMSAAKIKTQRATINQLLKKAESHDAEIGAAYNAAQPKLTLPSKQVHAQMKKYVDAKDYAALCKLLKAEHKRLSALLNKNIVLRMALGFKHLIGMN